MFFSSKHNILTEMIEEYLQQTETCMNRFLDSFKLYSEKGLGAEFDELVEKTHMAESFSDDLRRKIETTLYEKALIPESRGDIMDLVESIDKIPNKAESVLYQIQTELIEIPKEFLPKFMQLVRINHETFEDVTRGIRVLFKKMEEVKKITKEIDKKESCSDNLEREMIKSIFTSSIDKSDKLLLKELIIEIGNISDLCENVADKLTIIAVKSIV